jgi:hypothetical protein
MNEIAGDAKGLADKLNKIKNGDQATLDWYTELRQDMSPLEAVEEIERNKR